MGDDTNEGLKVSTKPMKPGDKPLQKGPLPIYANDAVKKLRKRDLMNIGTRTPGGKR